MYPQAHSENHLQVQISLPILHNLTFGGDAKIGIGSSLNLDLTVNPDFSQVEVDNQVTNLDRFEILFPEKRQFFLENADLFANFGMDGLRPFFFKKNWRDKGSKHRTKYSKQD